MTDQVITHGLAAIAESFARAKAEGRATFMPYWMLGYPDVPASIRLIEGLVAIGADAIELGIPFSDPLADGVVVQAAAQAALESGTKVSDCLNAVKTLRTHGVTIPLVLMSAFNPPMAYGIDRFMRDAAANGADGFILPDLPPDESGEVRKLCADHGLALISLLAPTSSPQRIALVTHIATGFIYLVAVTGVTGVRDVLSPELPGFVARVRAATDLPLSVGFGISRPEHVARIRKMADGAIVGSALLRTYAQEGEAAMLDLAKTLRAAC